MSVKRKTKYAMKDKFNVNDSMYTPVKLVEVIIPSIIRFWERWECKGTRKLIVWCPFDQEDSEFVRELRKLNKIVDVVYTHIDNNQDFFLIEPDSWDIAVSNPPFSMKLEVFRRLYSFKKPFAMLCNLMSLNYQNVGEFFLDKDLQLLIPDKKVSFNGHTSSFNSSYFCSKFLERDLAFFHMEDNNSKNKFVPAHRFEIETNLRNFDKEKGE